MNTTEKIVLMLTESLNKYIKLYNYMPSIEDDITLKDVLNRCFYIECKEMKIEDFFNKFETYLIDYHESYIMMEDLQRKVIDRLSFNIIEDIFKYDKDIYIDEVRVKIVNNTLFIAYKERIEFNNK